MEYSIHLLGSVSLLRIDDKQFGDKVFRIVAHMIPLGRREIKLSSQDLTIHSHIVIRRKGRIAAESSPRGNSQSAYKIYVITPIAQISTGGPYTCPFIISGARYPGVPHDVESPFMACVY